MFKIIKKVLSAIGGSFVISIMFCVLCSVFLASMAVAVPQYVNRQGFLRDTNGNAITGTRSMSFKLYDALTGGTAVWTQAAVDVTVTSGLYNVKLGPLTSVDVGTGNRWLEVTLGSDVMSPRLELLPSVYAITAGSAESATLADNATKVGGYAAASSGNSVVPVTGSDGKLSASVIPTSGVNVAQANYATLSGTATNATTVNNISANTTATASNLLPLDSNKMIKGASISAEAAGNTYALFVNGKVGSPTGSGFCVGTGTIGNGSASVTITNTAVTASSLIFLSVGHGATPDPTGNTYGGIRVSAISAGNSFTVKTMSDATSTIDIPFSYLIIN